MLEISDPDLGNSKPGIDWDLKIPILAQSGVRDFHREINIFTSRMFRCVVVGSLLCEQEIRLGLVVFVKPRGILNSDDSFTSEKKREQVRGAVDASGVPIPDGAHLEDFSFDKLHAILGLENACFGHSVIVIHREEFLSDVCSHVASFHWP